MDASLTAVYCPKGNMLITVRRARMRLRQTHHHQHQLRLHGRLQNEATNINAPATEAVQRGFS